MASRIQCIKCYCKTDISFERKNLNLIFILKEEIHWGYMSKRKVKTLNKTFT